RASHTPAIFLLAERDEIVAPRFQRLVVQANAGERRVIEVHGAHHNDPVEGTALADLNDALGWLLGKSRENPRVILSAVEGSREVNGGFRHGIPRLRSE